MAPKKKGTTRKPAAKKAAKKKPTKKVAKKQSAARSRRAATAEPVVVIEGMEVVIERDLKRHKVMLERAKSELLAWEQARGHEIARKRAWRKLVGTGKYDDEALVASRDQSNVNIRHLSDKIEAAKERIAFETNIVDTLSRQQEEQTRGLAALDEAKR